MIFLPFLEAFFGYVYKLSMIDIYASLMGSIRVLVGNLYVIFPLSIFSIFLIQAQPSRVSCLFPIHF